MHVQHTIHMQFSDDEYSRNKAFKKGIQSI
jgi:hypothetical protein